MYGRTLKIRIQGHRNSENEDLGFAFGAAAAVANQASNKLEAIWIEMDVRYKAVETTVAVAPAPCSIEAIVHKSRSFGEWWENCLEILQAYADRPHIACYPRLDGANRQELMRWIVDAGWNDLNPRLDQRGFLIIEEF